MRSFWKSQEIYFERFRSNGGKSYLPKGRPFDFKKKYVFLWNTDLSLLRKVRFCVIFRSFRDIFNGLFWNFERHKKSFAHENRNLLLKQEIACFVLLMLKLLTFLQSPHRKHRKIWFETIEKHLVVSFCGLQNVFCRKMTFPMAVNFQKLLVACVKFCILVTNFRQSFEPQKFALVCGWYFESATLFFNRSNARTR